MKIIHAADLHMGSPLRGLPLYDGAPVEALAPLLRSATRRAVEQLAKACVESDASLLLIAGDLFDGYHRFYQTGLRFTEELVRLREAGVRTVWVRGNHDAVSRVLKNLLLPEGVVELGLGGPESLVLDDLGVALHGYSYSERAVTEDLAARYPAPLPGLLNVGLLHTSAEGRPGHDPYAPCTVRRLAEHGYDYWALGHVHAREVAHRDPWVVFPGNLQGRSLRERGPKGATLVTVDGGRVTGAEPVALDVVRFEVCSVNVGGARSFDDIAGRAVEALRQAATAAAGRPLVARLLLSGGAEIGELFARAPAARVADLRRAAAEAGAGGAGIWLEELWAELREPPWGRWRLTPAARALAA